MHHVPNVHLFSEDEPNLLCTWWENLKHSNSFISERLGECIMYKSSCIIYQQPKITGRLGQQPSFQYITVNSVDSKMEDGDELWIGDNLTTIYEVALTIFHYSKKITSVKRKSVINKYADAVRNMWIRCFDDDHVISLSSVRRESENIMHDYESRVRCSHNMSSWRHRNRVCMSMYVPQPKWGHRNNSKNSSLFDIGRNMCDLTSDLMSDLTGDEKVFYEDQCGSRNHLLSQEIDWAHEEEQQAVLQQQIRGAQQLQEKLKFVNEDMEVIPTTSSRRTCHC